MDHPDIHWQQRFSHYQKALLQLNKAVELSRQRPLSWLEKLGIINVFEFTHELACSVMKDFFEYQGNTSITGSRDATRQAFQEGLIADGEGWMEMIQSRNQTVHTYNQEVADRIAGKVTTLYHDLFRAFEEKAQNLKKLTP